MILLIYQSDGGKVLLQVRQADAALNCQIYLDKGAYIRVLDGCDLANAGTAMDPRIPDTLADFDLLYPNQPAIVE